MGQKIRAFAIPGIALLAEGALQLSGYQNPTLAVVLYVIAAVWGGWALLTWTPLRRFLPQIQIRPSSASQERAARQARNKAVAELRERVGELQKGIGEVQVRIYRSAIRRLIRRHFLAENPTGLSQEQREWQPAPKWYGDKIAAELGIPSEDEYS